MKLASEGRGWLKPYSSQAIVNRCLLRRPGRVSGQRTLNWRRLSVLEGLGGGVLWWAFSVVRVVALVLLLSGVFLCVPERTLASLRRLGILTVCPDPASQDPSPSSPGAWR